MTNKDDPRVVELHRQIQEQYDSIGQALSAVVYANLEYLRAELYALGWNIRVQEDGKTVELYQRTTGNED